MANYTTNLSMSLVALDALNNLPAMGPRTLGPFVFGAADVPYMPMVLPSGTTAITLPSSSGVSQCLIWNRSAINVTVQANFGSGLVTLGVLQPGGLCIPLWNIVSGGGLMTGLTLVTTGTAQVEIFFGA